MNVLPPGTADDPARSRATADDRLAAARDVLIARGVDHARLVTLADGLKVSRSGFYRVWRDRAASLAAVIDLWQQPNHPEITGLHPIMRGCWPTPRPARQNCLPRAVSE